MEKVIVTRAQLDAVQLACVEQIKKDKAANVYDPNLEAGMKAISDCIEIHDGDDRIELVVKP